MVNRTDNRLYIYPECDPPLVKDRSDIDYLRELAVEVNNDAATLDARLQDFVEKPDAARIAFAGNVTILGTPGASFLVPYNVTTYDNTAGSVDLASNALVPLERGWYAFCSQVRCTNGGGVNMGVRHGKSGTVYQKPRRYEGMSSPITANEDSMTTFDVLRCDAGDFIRTRVITDGIAGTYAWEARLSMIQLHKLDT